MRGLKVAVVVMGVLVVLGTIALAIAIARRSAAPVVSVTPPSGPFWAFLDEPTGTRIARIVVINDRLAVQLEGGGSDRVVLIDPATGSVSGRISLAR